MQNTLLTNVPVKKKWGTWGCAQNLTLEPLIEACLGVVNFQTLHDYHIWEQKWKVPSQEITDIGRQDERQGWNTDNVH